MNYTVLAVVDASDTGVEQVVAATTEEKTTTDAAHSDTTEHAAGETTAHATEDTGHAAEESEGIAALGLSPTAIGAQLLTFLVLFIVIKKFALSGIVKNLQKRHDDINRGLHLTAEMDKQKAELDARVDEALKAARKEADLIIAEAHSETGKMIQAAEEKANNRADEILRAAEGKIERDITEARNGLKKEMAGLITEATEAILGTKLDASADRKLVEDYLKGSDEVMATERRDEVGPDTISDRIRQEVAVDIWLDAVDHVRRAREGAGLPSIGLSDDVRDEIDVEIGAAMVAKVHELAGLLALDRVMDNAWSVNRG